MLARALVVGVTLLVAGTGFAWGVSTLSSVNARLAAIHVAGSNSTTDVSPRSVPIGTGRPESVIPDPAAPRRYGTSPGGDPNPRVGNDPTDATYSTVTGVVVGNLDGYGTAPAMAGVTVIAYGVACSPSPPSPSSCPVLNTTSTRSDGGFSMNLSIGSSYYIAASPDPSITGADFPAGFGGAAANVTVKSAGTSVDLSVYPEVAYGNATIVLPDYTCDSAYVDDFKGDGPGCQNPVLSWTRSGAYYLTSANELAYYSFVNRTLYNLTAWIPLYQDFPEYAMIPNQLFITQDGSYLYGWGTLTNRTENLTAEAVNVTTDQRFEYNFTGVTTNSVAANGQVELTGWDGNDSQLTLILANGSVIDHPLWGHGQNYVGNLDYFEANNVYWEPYLNGYIDVEAEGSSGDGIEEWQLSGASDLSLTRTFRATWGSGIVVNGVNGIAFNVTSRELSVQAEWSGLTYAVNSNGTLTTLLQVTNRYPRGSPPAVPIGPISESDRPELIESGPMLDGNYEGFANDSWLVSMTPGHLGFYATNVSPYFPNGQIAGVPDYSWAQWAQEGQFYNASYLIAPDSYVCTKDFHGACAINGTGAEAGTIWWMWRLGLPEFPESVNASAGEPTDPPATEIVSAQATDTSIRIRWTPPSPNDVINYTVAWGTTGAYTHYASVGPANDTFTIVDLAPSTRYYFSVEAWNLHFHGTSGGVGSAVTAHVTYTVTFREKGLPSKTLWNVTVGSVIRASNGSTIHFSERNGSYQYTVRTPVSGASTGSFTVGDAGVSISLPFYHITFKDSGLPSGTWWSLTTNGLELNSTTESLSFYLGNGTYAFVAVPGLAHYTDAFGNFTVNGTHGTVTVKFTKSAQDASSPAGGPERPSSLARRRPVSRIGASNRESSAFSSSA